MSNTGLSHMQQWLASMKKESDEALKGYVFDYLFGSNEKGFFAH